VDGDSDWPIELTPEWRRARGEVLQHRSEPYPPLIYAYMAFFIGISLLTVFGGAGSTFIDEIGATVVSGGAGYWYGRDKKARFNARVRQAYYRITTSD
jgi:uncharacterized membrane protein YjjP (DUF1212 family)